MTKIFLTDPEAACYAVDAATCLFIELGNANYAAALVNLVALLGWTKNAVTK